MKFILDFDRVLFDTDAFKEALTQAGIDFTNRSRALFDEITAADIKFEQFLDSATLQFLREHSHEVIIISSFHSRISNINFEAESEAEWQLLKIQAALGDLAQAVTVEVTGESKAEAFSKYTATEEIVYLLDDEPEHIEIGKQLGFTPYLYSTSHNRSYTTASRVASFTEFIKTVETSMETRPIRIALATGLYPPEIGGPATYTAMLEAALPEHGFELIVVPYGEVRRHHKLIRHWVYAYKVYKAARQADCIYALDPASVGLPAWLVSVLTRKPLLLRVAGDYAWEQGQQRFGLTATLDEYTADKRAAPVAVRFFAMVQSFVVRRAQKVVVPSEYMKRIVSTWGATNQQLRVIYSALFPLTVAESKVTLREQLAYDGFVISSVGRLAPWKGFKTLIEVVAKLKAEDVQVTLIIAGDGPDAESLKAQVEKLELQDQVRLVGRLSKDALGAMLKASDCFVLNTGYEGLSHQLLEVMDLKIPVITTNVGGNPELISDGVSGLLVDFNDGAALMAAIKRLKDNETLQEHLVQNAKARTSDFTQEKVVTDIVELLKDVSCPKN